MAGDGALGLGDLLGEEELRVVERADEVHGGSGGGGVGVVGSLVVAQRGEDLDEGAVLRPARRDDAWLDGEAADEVVAPTRRAPASGRGSRPR